MTLPSDISRSFRLYVTHVDGEGHFLKVSGQLDQQSSLMVESLFESARENLEKGIGAVPPAAIHEGIICAAKYKDGTYYRAKVINTANLASGLVGVHFIDYGNKDIISVSTIRFLDNYDPMFLQLRGQASDYYLSRIMHASGRWDEPLLLKIQSLICYAEYPASIEATTRTLPIISIQFKGNDLSTHLVSTRFGHALPVAKQEVLLMQFLSNEGQAAPAWHPNFVSESLPTYPEHVPFLINQNFPSNPASAMRLQQNVSLPFNGNIPPPSLISQRLLVNKVSRTPVTVKGPIRQPQHAPQSSIEPATPPAAAPPQTQLPSTIKPVSPKKSTTYKSRLLEVGSQHKVFVSFAEEGPELFAVQLVTDAKKLQDMMDEINRRPHHSLAEPPMIGTVCLGRMSGDRIICRAIVMNLSGSQCKLFFVDFGDTEMVSYYDIFDIPQEFVTPNVFAMRFCLSGVKKLEKGPHLNEIFKQLVNGKVLTLRVVSPEGPPLIQYGELYLDGKNVLDLLLANVKDKMQFKWLEMLPLGSKKSILVSYVDSCLKFYVQLSENIEELNAVMDAVKIHCDSSSSPGELPVGAACCARFPDDDNWYRARILSTNGDKITVAYVDYGNEQDVNVSDLRTITPELIRLPAQAMKCALKGYENKPVETKSSNQLEMLALEKTLMAHVVGVISNDTMLVTLIDDTVSPPLDVARRMMQLSTPRSTNETKVNTPVRKDAPESFSSPEGSEDSRKKGFRREKSFKDERERRPRDQGTEEFGQRGSSFRGRENKDGFDRSGPGRHSDKFGGRPDRPDRRGGKPWENSGSAPDPAPPAPPAPAPVSDDQWEEAAPQPTFNQAPPARQNSQGNRRKPHERGPHDRPRPDYHDRPRPDHDRGPRPDHDRGPRPGWKSKDSAVGRRLHQAAEAASADSQPQKSFSVQDRLKRDNRFNNNNEWEENKSNDWGNKGRPERRDNRGDRRDTWGDKKENFNKRERDSNRDNNRGDRNRSNFTPRERADRSFNSDIDKKSDKSFKSQDSGGRAGRAPPYKSRSKFTQVQYRELPDPIPLETPFEEATVEPGAQHEVSVTWIISPASFYTQILTLQPKFLEMMHKIPELYKGVKSYTGMVPVGASVLARYPADGVLYRATVVAVQPFSKFIVQYVDFGNKQLVDAKDIWQLDKQLTELPKMAVHCSLLGVAPKDGEWKANPDIDLCFNAPRYQCVFEECVEEGQWGVYLWNDGVSVGDTLVEKELAVMSDHQSSVALKDEAIDLTIIVGQQILCKVTHVKSYEEFYVQLDLEKAALVEAAIANFDKSKLTPLAADSLSDGIHCTVNHEGKIYRAIIEDASDPQQIRAVLPDYGRTVTTALANLMILPTELSVYYYQSLQCGLHNYTADSTALLTLEQLKETLTGNTFIVYINYVDGIKLMSTLYSEETGDKICIFTPDEGAYESVVPLCARAVFNYSCGRAYISHAAALHEIYLQRAADTQAIEQLLDDLYKFYQDGSPEPLTNFEPDTLCCALAADGNWYRATVLEEMDSELKVHFTDYGNSETVSKDNVKVLDKKFYSPCALALEAGLGLHPLTDDALDTLLGWVRDKEVQLTLAFGADGWLASLHLDGVDLALRLVEEKRAAPAGAEPPASDPPAASPAPADPADPAPAPHPHPPGCARVYVSHVDTPGHFWLQMADKVDTIEEIQADLQAHADSYPELESRELGAVCVAKYLADERWYRAEILDADADITTVRFLDYGNTDVLDHRPGLLKAAPARWRDAERGALRSSVDAVPTGTGEWSEAAADHFRRLVPDPATPVDARIVLRDVTTYVDVYLDGRNVTDELVAAGHATRAERPAGGAELPTCFASHVNSPSEFWIQLETAAPELRAMEAAMVDAESFPPLAERREGALCAARYPEDGAWYRAQVVVDATEGTEVLFTDYGNASIADELRALPAELEAKPALSRKCALQKPRDVKAWSRRSESKFNELAAEGATIFDVQFIASGDISIVELYLDGRSVTEELVALCDTRPPASAPAPAERPPPLGQGVRGEGKLCHVNSAEDFYVQLDDFAPEIDKILDKLVAAESFDPPTELKVGSMCAAFWDEDEQWYRARILEFCDVGYHVQFVDYGNKAKCELFRRLPEDLSVIEPAAKFCRLADSGDDAARREATDRLLEDYAAEAVTFQIEFLDSTREPTLVKLFLDGKDISTIVASKLEAKADTDAAPLTELVLDESLKEDKEEVCTAKPPEPTDPLGIQTSDLSHADEGDPKKQIELSSQPQQDDETRSEESSQVNDNKPDILEQSRESETKSENKGSAMEQHEDIASEEKVLQSKPVEEEEKSFKETTKSAESNKDSETNLEERNTDNTEIGLKDVPPATDESQKDNAEVVNDESELNTSLPELDDSIDSSNTVIENKSFECSSEEFIDANDVNVPSPEKDTEKDVSGETLENSNDTVETPERDDSKDYSEKDLSGETLENSNETIKTPERDDSKDSLNTDTGYTSETLSPTKEESSSPVKTTDSPKKNTEIKEQVIEIETKQSSDVVEENAVNNTQLKSTP